MKNNTSKLRIIRSVVALILICNIAFSQTVVRINPAQNGAPAPALYQKGVFSNPRNTVGENVFYSVGATPFNMLRDHTIEYRMLTSTSFSDCLAKISATQAYHIDKAQRTSKLNLLIAGTPTWLSSSTDTTTFEGAWHLCNTKAPSNYALWDSLVRGIVSIVKGWGITPYYELWNEPDGGYWTGTTEELLKLYRHTSIAVKQADPNAKIGAFGLNGWSRGIGVGTVPPNFGYLPDSIANQTALLAKLIDSLAMWGSAVPIDFISWHYFSIYPNEIQRAETFFKNKIAGYGMAPIPFLITEWNTITSSRETPFHVPQILRCYDKLIEGGGIEGQAVSVFQDWNYNSPTEFYKDYGVVSYNGLIKPALKAMMLLDYLHAGADSITVTESLPMESFASVKSDTVKILLSNYVYYPFYAAIEELLYNHPFNQVDLVNAGYTTSGQIDSTFKGLLAPIGPPSMVAAFNKAKIVYTEHTANALSKRNISLRLKNQTGLKSGKMIVIDSTNNNIIHKYDSMLLAGSTRAQAVAALYPAQAFAFSNIQLSDSIFNFTMQANATVFLEFYGINTLTAGPEFDVQNSAYAYPNPFNRFTRITLRDNTPLTNAELMVYDVQGREMKCSIRISSNEINFDTDNWPQGEYIYVLKNEGNIIGHGKMVKQ